MIFTNVGKNVRHSMNRTAKTINGSFVARNVRLCDFISTRYDVFGEQRAGNKF